jgi:hypothetical protein
MLFQGADNMSSINCILLHLFFRSNTAIYSMDEPSANHQAKRIFTIPTNRNTRAKGL